MDGSDVSMGTNRKKRRGRGCVVKHFTKRDMDFVDVSCSVLRFSLCLLEYYAPENSSA